MTAFVLDASVVISWAFPYEHDEAALAALVRLGTEPAYVPAVWWFEVRNVLLINERRKRITEVDMLAFLRSLSEMNIKIDRTPVEDATLALARHHRLTVYDASYLELAVRARIPLATLDRKLAAAAEREGVSPIR